MTATAGGTSRFEPIAVSDESTVVAEFVADPSEATGYQSEAELEATFIAQLGEQAYEYLRIGSRAELEANLRTQLAPVLSKIQGHLGLSYWIDGQHLLRKVEETETVSGQLVHTTILYRNINQPVHVTVPPASQVSGQNSVPGL